MILRPALHRTKYHISSGEKITASNTGKQDVLAVESKGNGIIKK